MNAVKGGFLQEELFPIRTVSKLTGVNSVTLRAWERRYGLITPKRTDTGHRLFSKDDIKMIQQANSLLQEGVSISQVSKQLKSSQKFETLLVDQPTTIWEEYLEKMVFAVSEFDEDILDEVYQEALSYHAINVVTQELIIPLLRILGERWVNLDGGIAEEHFFSVYLRNKLGAQYHHKRGRNNGPLLIVACMPGETHEFAILLFGLIAHQHNYRMIILGADMPLDEIPYIVEKKQASALILSCNKNCTFTASTLAPLTNIATTPIFVGGHMSDEQKDMLKRFHATPLDCDFQKTIDIVNSQLKPQLS